MKYRQLTRYTWPEILEAKNYYFDEAMKMQHSYHRENAVKFLEFFNHYFAIQEGASIEDLIKRDTEYLWARNNINRVEQKLETYFKLRELNRL